MGKITKINSGKAQIMDGWINVLTGLGLSNKDKLTGGQATWDVPIEQELEFLYAGDDVAQRIVNTLPDDAFREGIKFDADHDITGAVEKQFDRLGVLQKYHKAWQWARLYGGAVILMIVDDSRDLSQPLDPNAVRSVTGLLVLHRFELMPLVTDLDRDISSPTFGMPKKYLFYPRRGSALPKEYGQEIHISRLVRFDGVHLPQSRFIANNYWHDSVLNNIQNAIRNYNITNDAVALILQEFNQGVFKMKDLADMLAQGDDALVQQRLTAINISRSVARAVVIDKDGEDFVNVAAQVSGIPDMVKAVSNRLIMAAHMPHTKILGESPSGLGATGDSEVRDWYDYVANQQEKFLRPRLQLFMEVLLKSRLGPTDGKVPDKFGFTFNPLWQMSDKEQADIRKSQAETDQIYIQNGVVDANEIAISRFGGGKFSTDTQIDLDLRKIEPQPVGESVTSVAANPLPGANINPQATTASQPTTPEAKAPSQKTDSAKPKTRVIRDEDENEELDLDGGPGSGPQGGGAGGSNPHEKDFKKADKHVEAMGNKYDKNPSPENKANLEKALKARDAAKEARDNHKSVEEHKAHISGLEQKLAEVKAARAHAENKLAESKARSAALRAKLK